jgi:putative phosphoesterase
MRLVVMSDIHGNLEALRSVEASLPDHDRVVVAGDHCLEGPRPAEVVDMLRDLGWELLMGNTDRDIVFPPADMNRRKLDVVDWARRRLGPERVEWLATLPFSISIQAEGVTVLAVHANPVTMDEHLQPTMSEEELAPYLSGVEADIVAFGHLHTPYVRPVGKFLLVDVSSVGHPKDCDLRSAYTVFDWGGGRRSVNQVRIPYDVERTVADLRSGDMPYAAEEIESLLKASY